MLTTLLEYKAYFQALATTLGCSFVYANRGRVLAKQSSELVYPVLWLPVPDIRLNRADGKQYVFQGAAVFLDHAAADDYDGQDAALERMLPLATAAIDLMETESAGRFIFDDSEVPMEHVAFWSADCDFGWKIEFEIRGANFC